MEKGSPPMTQYATIEDPDEIVEGDKLVKDLATHNEVKEVMETDVIERMAVPAEDGDGVDFELTAGVRVRGGLGSDTISYQRLTEKLDRGSVELHRPASKLTDEQLAAVREAHR